MIILIGMIPVAVITGVLLSSRAFPDVTVAVAFLGMTAALCASETIFVDRARTYSGQTRSTLPVILHAAGRSMVFPAAWAVIAILPEILNFAGTGVLLWQIAAWIGGLLSIEWWRGRDCT